MPSDQLSTTFSALADPTRRAILARLTTGEKTVSDLAEPFDMTMPAVTKHLKVLEKANLVERTGAVSPVQAAPRPVERYRRVDGAVPAVFRGEF